MLSTNWERLMTPTCATKQNLLHTGVISIALVGAVWRIIHLPVFLPALSQVPDVWNIIQILPRTLEQNTFVHFPTIISFMKAGIKVLANGSTFTSNNFLIFYLKWVKVKTKVDEKQELLNDLTPLYQGKV